MITGRTVNFNGATTWTDGAVADNAFGAINANAGAVLNNHGTFLDQINGNPSYIGANGGGATFNNSGSYIKSGASTTNLSLIKYVNAGITDVQVGTIDLPTNFSNPGTLKGSGTFATNVLTDNGHVDPGDGVGTLTIAGNYVQTARGTFDVDLQSATSHDLLTVEGSATLSGVLNLVCYANCTFDQGDVISILDADPNELSGVFSSVMTSGFGDTRFGVVYDRVDGDVLLDVMRTTVAAVPEPRITSMMVLGLGLLASGRWLRRRLSCAVD